MTPPTVLLVGDAPHIADVVEYMLRDQGFDVRWARDANARLALQART